MFAIRLSATALTRAPLQSLRALSTTAVVPKPQVAELFSGGLHAPSLILPGQKLLLPEPEPFELSPEGARGGQASTPRNVSPTANLSPLSEHKKNLAYSNLCSVLAKREDSTFIIGHTYDLQRRLQRYDPSIYNVEDCIVLVNNLKSCAETAEAEGFCAREAYRLFEDKCLNTRTEWGTSSGENSLGRGGARRPCITPARPACIYLLPTKHTCRFTFQEEMARKKKVSNS